jgi:hypothetical protein
MPENPRLLRLGMKGYPLEGEAEVFSSISGMVEGYTRYTKGLKPWALAK